jgi:hypothetical protein
MGSWGNNFFENDEAVDWLCKLEKFINQAVEGNGPRGSIDEMMAAIYFVTTLEIKPNFRENGSCPLGWKFPNMRMADSCLKSIKEMKKQVKKGHDDAIHINKQLDVLQDKIETIKNKLIAECL